MSAMKTSIETHCQLFPVLEKDALLVLSPRETSTKIRRQQHRIQPAVRKCKALKHNYKYTHVIQNNLRTAWPAVFSLVSYRGTVPPYRSKEPPLSQGLMRCKPPYKPYFCIIMKNIIFEKKFQIFELFLPPPLCFFPGENTA